MFTKLYYSETLLCWNLMDRQFQFELTEFTGYQGKFILQLLWTIVPTVLVLIIPAYELSMQYYIWTMNRPLFRPNYPRLNGQNV